MTGFIPTNWRSASPDEKSTREEKLPDQFERGARPIESGTSGFIQAIAMDNLFTLAQEKNLIIRLRRRPGQFIAEGDILAEVVPPRSDDSLPDEILRHVFFGRDRTPTQDIEYSVDQLVEVAVRALSPGVNDPSTAISCIEWLGAALIQMAERKIPSHWRYDENGKLRVITDATDFEGIAASALNQVRQYGRSSVAVTVRLLDVLARIGPHLVRPNDRAVLLGHALAVRDDGVAAAPNERDRRDIEEMFVGAEQALAL